MFDFSLGETADAIRDATARFAADNIAPLATEIDGAALIGWDAARAYAGFDNRPSTIRAAPLHGCSSVRPGAIRCNTVHPRDLKSSEIKLRWHCHHIASAHITAVGFFRARVASASRASRYGGVSM